MKLCALIYPISPSAFPQVIWLSFFTAKVREQQPTDSMSMVLKELQNSPMSLYMSPNEKRGTAQQKMHLLPQGYKCLEDSLPKGWYHLPTPHTRQSIINSKGGSSADDSLSMLIRDSIGRPDYRNHLLDLINYWAHQMWLLSHIKIQVKEGIKIVGGKK